MDLVLGVIDVIIFFGFEFILVVNSVNSLVLIDYSCVVFEVLI